jgi:hypothetical protein
VILEGTLGEYRVVKCSQVEGPEDEWALRLCEGSSLRLRRSTASMDVVRRQNMSSLCDRGRNVYHTLHEHCLGLPIDTGVVGSMSIIYSCFGVETYDRSEMGDNCLTGAATGLVPVREVPDLASCRE